MININELSTEEILKLKDQCTSIINERHKENMHKILDKLFSVMTELNRLDEWASIDLEGGEYDWEKLMEAIKSEYCI